MIIILILFHVFGYTFDEIINNNNVAFSKKVNLKKKKYKLKNRGEKNNLVQLIHSNQM